MIVHVMSVWGSFGATENFRPMTAESQLLTRRERKRLMPLMPLKEKRTRCFSALTPGAAYGVLWCPSHLRLG